MPLRSHFRAVCVSRNLHMPVVQSRLSLPASGSLALAAVGTTGGIRIHPSDHRTRASCTHSRSLPVPSLRFLRHALLPASIVALGLVSAASAQVGAMPDHRGFPPPHHFPWPSGSPQDRLPTATPIKHLVVIFGENRSFDHYFGTYPVAANPAGEPAFHARPWTPRVDGLDRQLLTRNPNKLNPLNGENAVNPFRLDRTQANTEGQNHNYTPEQLAYDNGKADLFPHYTGNNTVSSTGTFGTHGLVMGYYDGNTVTALWNYAQHFAMDDNAYTDTYGPSTPGAIAVVSGTNNGAQIVLGKGATIADGIGGLSLVGDTDPAYD